MYFHLTVPGLGCFIWNLWSSLWHMASLVVACKLLVVAWGILLADQGLNMGPLHWEHRVLATSWPGKSQQCVFDNIFATFNIIMKKFHTFKSLCIKFLKWLLRCYVATAKSLQSCPTLCNPIDGSPPGSPVPGILQARTLEWVAISFSNAWKWSHSVVSDS